MKVMLEKYYTCTSCGQLYEVDKTSDPADHLGNHFCDDCSLENTTLYEEKYLPDAEPTICINCGTYYTSLVPQNNCPECDCCQNVDCHVCGDFDPFEYYERG